MSLSPRKIVRIFYEADLIHNEQILKDYLHAEVTLNWNSSFGFSKKNFDDILRMFKGMQSAFEFSRNKITHLLTDKNTVTIRHTFFAKAIERSKEEAIAHFMCIWELKEDKLYKGYMISQQADFSVENMETFL
ncbi:nuclear transport factor 2 family protein [Aquimarina agarivorans]|uniref:nuclear transport factor 2 family protein n=1 Tax=Aquimarina agarivorans TaxID=980584 RepID=UPI000248EFD1|nr:nuclear transport factor 2 family protein [Aquimarina agarivorans]